MKPTLTPELEALFVLALARIDTNAAAKEIERMLAAARFAGGAETAAALGYP